MAKENTNEKIGSWLAVFSVLVPALIVSGFMPVFNILPFSAWLTIATIGSSIGGAIYTKRLYLGLISGGLSGAGALLGIKYYVFFRHFFIEGHTFSSLEILIGAALGAIPGIATFYFFSKDNNPQNK